MRSPPFETVACAIAVSFLIYPHTAAAHAFVQRYDLPLPLGLFMAGAGVAVAASFLVAAVAVRRTDVGYASLELTRWAWFRALAFRILAPAARAVVLSAFLLTVAAGLLGASDPFRNLAPTMVWVLWWVGFAFACALLGNLWRLTNPLVSLYAVVRCAVATVAQNPRLPRRRLPDRIGLWPSVVLFLAFAWCEIVWHGAETPANLVLLILAYAALTWTGMAVFGARAWLACGEAFTQVFGLFARFAPLDVRSDGDGRPRLFLRFWGMGLLTEKPVSPSLAALVLVVLATVSFDGFRETGAWVAITDAALESSLLVPALRVLHAAGLDLFALFTTLGLFATPVIFYAVFLGVCALMRAAAGPGAPGPGEAVRLFVLTLVPIAIAYHLAHYLSLLLLAGQLIIPLASDPFGFGWDLFGTALYRLDLGVVGAKFVWYAAVTAILLGHIVAVYLAHRIAFATYPTARAAVRSQLPLVALMVGYTTASLWIMAQPIVA